MGDARTRAVFFLRRLKHEKAPLLSPSTMYCCSSKEQNVLEPHSEPHGEPGEPSEIGEGRETADPAPQPICRAGAQERTPRFRSSWAPCPPSFTDSLGSARTPQPSFIAASAYEPSFLERLMAGRVSRFRSSWAPCPPSFTDSLGSEVTPRPSFIESEGFDVQYDEPSFLENALARCVPPCLPRCVDGVAERLSARDAEADRALERRAGEAWQTLACGLLDRERTQARAPYKPLRSHAQPTNQASTADLLSMLPPMRDVASADLLSSMRLSTVRGKCVDELIQSDPFSTARGLH